MDKGTDRWNNTAGNDTLQEKGVDLCCRHSIQTLELPEFLVIVGQ